MNAWTRRLWFWVRRNLPRRGYPRITNTWIDRVREVDPTARICECRIYGAFSAGRHVRLDGCDIQATAPVTVGDYSILTGPITIVASRNPVEIGKFCSIAPGVIVWEALHDSRRLSTYAALTVFFSADFREDLVSKGPVRIGHDVWIGARAVILSGVTIGNGAIVGAGSVVTRDVPPYTLVAGAPAKPVKRRFADGIVDELQRLQWWNWNERTIRENRPLFERELTVELLRSMKAP